MSDRHHVPAPTATRYNVSEPALMIRRRSRPAAFSRNVGRSAAGRPLIKCSGLPLTSRQLYEAPTHGCTKAPA